MKNTSRAMLEKWAASINDRRVILEFWEWVDKRGVNRASISEFDVERLLDEYHGIDQGRLEAERRELLETYNRS